MSADQYSFVLNTLADRGVRIEIAYYETRVNIGIVHELSRQEIAHYPVTPRGKGALMHHKFCIIDDAVLITGSYNWTKNARRHFENIIIVENEFELVKQYKHEFEDIKEFVRGPTGGRRKRCFCCQSPAYHLAVFYPNDGYSPISNGVWQICEWQRHAKLIASETWTADDEFDEEREDDDEPTVRVASVDAQREKMLREFVAERDQLDSIRVATARRFGMPIDVIGVVRESDDDGKGGGVIAWHQLEREIAVQWRAVYYRKKVPDILSEEGGFKQVIRGTEWSF
jgi:hypothetical protein